MRLAAVDIGSNTVHALVADAIAGRLIDVAHFVEMPALGAAVARTGRIGPEKAEEAIAALASVVERSRNHGYEHLVAGATEAVRRASDGAEFLARAGESIRQPVRLISPRREAELSFAGVASGHAGRGQWLMADIGGGSTELVVAKGRRMEGWCSLPIGSGVLSDRHLSDPPLPGEREALRREARSLLEAAPACTPRKLVATGGTASNLPLVLSASRPAAVLTVRAILRARARLDSGAAEEVGRAHGLPASRVRALRAGVEVLLLLLDRSGLDRLHVSHRGIRHGMLLAYLARGDAWYAEPV
jgi:exopolyphosphatase/guanosine-5'-triphosphate,3'-diphosphate pyrophosphatase